MSVDNDKFMERIKQIDGKLRSYSRLLAYRSGFMEADDLYQEALLKLYERYVSEPDFFSNNNSYLWCYGIWMMKNAVNHERYIWINKVTNLETERGERPRLTNHFPNPENEVIREEVRDIARQMPKQCQIIFNGTIQGYEPQELAYIFGISSGALKWRKRNMIGILKQAWHTPIKDRERIIRQMDRWPSVVNTPSYMVEISDRPIPIDSSVKIDEELVY